ncbi:MAG: hypothetical protein V3V00_13910 [Saprospiraceae bacterium]
MGNKIPFIEELKSHVHFEWGFFYTKVFIAGEESEEAGEIEGGGEVTNKLTIFYIFIL